MNPSSVSSLLRWALVIDTVSCTATGLLLLVGAGLLEAYLGLPAMLLRYAGALLLPFAGRVAYLAARRRVSRFLAWGVIGGNTLWAVGSVLLLSGWVSPTALGIVIMLV
jgi:hypothetical protein